MEEDKNKTNQNTRPNGEERTTGPKSKSDDKWKDEFKHKGVGLFYTALQVVAFVASGILVTSGAKKISTRTPKTDDFVDSLLTIKRPSANA